MEVCKSCRKEGLIKAPAKLNLYLKVLRKREDGYHDILSVMVPISIYDRLYFREDSEISLECSDPSLPTDEKNLAFKAAKLYFEKAGIKKGLHIRLEKNIPHASGLGGGSSDAASVLIYLNKIYKKFSLNELLDMAKTLGADVPFFIYGTPCIAKGIGDILEPLPYRKLHFLVITPNIKVSTAWVYERFKLDLTKSELSSIKKMWEKGRIESLLSNDLESVTIRYFPEVGDLKEMLLKAGAKGVLMTGSGPTVFGIFESRAAAKKATEYIPTDVGKIFIASSLGVSPSGKARAFGARIRGFESLHPSH